MSKPLRQNPVVEIVGADFANKGAELMMRTTMLEVDERLDGARYAMSIFRGTPAERRAAGIADVIWRPSRNRAASAAHRLLSTAFAALPRTSRELLPDMSGRRGAAATTLNWWRSAAAARSTSSLLPGEVDLVLDVSGYAYGDAWGWHYARSLPAYYRQIRRRGGRIVLLPQTFGPFKSERGRQIFREVYAAADLCYARDDISYELAAGVLPDSRRLRRAPDITTRKIDGGADFDWAAGKACIIPNRNMVTHGAEQVARTYIDFLTRLLRTTRQMGAEPFLLIHDRNGGDESIALQVVAQVGGEVPLILEEDPFRLKAIIGRCFCVVSSRFHGLVNALSQGVPSLATGWAHKYETLMADYGVPEALLDPLADDYVLRSSLRRLFDPEARAATSARLLAKEAERVRAVDAMWQEVIGPARNAQNRPG